jgi:lipopolysaccharide exporter
VIRAVGWSTLAYAASRGATLLATLVLAHLLTPDAFGVVAAVLAYLAVIELASDLGMQATVIYEQEHGITPRVQSALTVNLLLAGVVTLGGVLLAPAVAAFFGAGDHVDLFRLAALNPIFTGLGNIHDGLLMRGMQFRRRLTPQVVRAVVRAVAGVALALAGAGAGSLVISYLLGTLAWALVLWVLVPLRPTFALDPAIVRSMAGYGGGAVLLEIVAVIGTRLDIVVIGRVLGATALGLYTVGYRIPELFIESVAWNVSLVAFPALARRRSVDRETLAPATLRIVRASALYAMPVGAALAITAPALVVVLFGQRWAGAAPVLASMAVMSAVVAVSFPLGDVFKALGRQRVMVAVNLAGLPVLVVALLLAAPAGLAVTAWTRAGVGVLSCLATVVAIAITLRLHPIALIAALGPGLATAGAVLLSAGAVRLSWPAATLLAAIGALAAGATGALAMLAAIDLAGLQSVVRRVLVAGGRGRGHVVAS